MPAAPPSCAALAPCAKKKIIPHATLLVCTLPPSSLVNTVDSRQISVAARFAALPVVLNWIEQRAEACGLDNALSKRIQLVAEELFVNSLHDGYGSRMRCGNQSGVGNRCTSGQPDFQRSPPPFDMSQSTPLQASSERIGGIGLNLVRALASSIRYQRSNDCNITRLDFPASASPHNSRLSN